MDNTIRPTTTTVGGPASPPPPAVPRPEAAAPVAQDTVSISAQPAAAPQAAPRQEQPAPAPQAPPPVVMPPEHPQGIVEVPVTLAVPVELLQPDEHGNVPLSMYTPDLRPPNAIYTTQDQIKELVDTVKKQTLPPGTHPELDDTPLSRKFDVGRKTYTKVMTSIGGIAAYSLAREGARFTLPANFAAPLAILAGGISLAGGLEQAAESAKLRGYYEGLQKEGVASLPIQLPNQQPVEVPIDRMIQSAKDATVVGGAQAISGGLMLGAGAAMLFALPVAPALAIGSIVLSVAAPLYAARGQFAMVAKAAWAKIKGAFHHKEANPAEQQQRTEPTLDPSAQPQPQQVNPNGRTEPTLEQPQAQ